MPDLGGLTDARIYSANPHMHLVGTHIAGKIERTAARGSEPQNECLANGGWNFDWQRTYIYDTPLDRLPSVAVGDTIDITCHWNNTIDKPVPAAHQAGAASPRAAQLVARLLRILVAGEQHDQREGVRTPECTHS